MKENEVPPITGFGPQADEIYAFSSKIGKEFIHSLSQQTGQRNARKVDSRVPRISSAAPELREVIPYSQIYGCHPSLLKASPTNLVPVGSHTDPYTSKDGAVMAARHKQLRSPDKIQAMRNARNYRIKIIKEQPMPWMARLDAPKRFSDNADSLDSSLQGTLNRICAAKNKPAKKFAGPKRKGAKAVKKMERAANASFLLDRDEATMFRALSARANFLAQDRPDINFSTKELCREFSQPNQKSFLRLKRLIRYLVGLPRLVFEYKFPPKGQAPATSIDLFCDTDFAGCRETRRSTSGGVALINGKNVKHWAKTQSTIALSSGEAELNGIGAGIAQGLGIQSICRDLGYDYTLRVWTDATAAIGIARRRGMGKIRHLDTTDLWIQEVIRSGRVELNKVLGAENPADIFTKYVDKALMTKMLSKMHMVQMDGRAKCAPAIAAQ